MGKGLVMARNKKLVDLKKRQKELKALLEKIESAISRTAEENIHSYEIDTGPESRYALERPKLNDLMKTRKTLQEELDVIEEEILAVETGTAGRVKRVMFYFPK